MGLAHGVNIVNDGLVFQVDAANPRSYPGSGTTAIDIVGNKSGTLSSTPMFENINLGVFDNDATNMIKDKVKKVIFFSISVAS